MEYSYNVNNSVQPPQQIYEFYSNNKNSKIGEMVCHKTETVLRPDNQAKSLAIDYLETATHDIGTGKNIMRFAYERSKELGCEGNIIVKADNSISPERIPHLFYRRMGFSTNNPNIDKQMDKFIKRNQSATSKDFSSMIMYYPPIHENTRSAAKLFKRLLGLFR